MDRRYVDSLDLKSLLQTRKDLVCTQQVFQDGSAAAAAASLSLKATCAVKIETHALVEELRSDVGQRFLWETFCTLMEKLGSPVEPVVAGNPKPLLIDVLRGGSKQFMKQERAGDAPSYGPVNISLYLTVHSAANTGKVGGGFVRNARNDFFPTENLRLVGIDKNSELEVRKLINWKQNLKRKEEETAWSQWISPRLHQFLSKTDGVKFMDVDEDRLLNVATPVLILVTWNYSLHCLCHKIITETLPKAEFAAEHTFYVPKKLSFREDQ